MKNPVSRVIPLACSLMALCSLTGCSEQEARMMSLKDEISQAREANETSTREINELNQKLSQLRQEISKQDSAKKEFAAKSAVSSETAKLAVKFRTELEASVQEYSRKLAAFKQADPAP